MNQTLNYLSKLTGEMDCKVNIEKPGKKHFITAQCIINGTVYLTQNDKCKSVNMAIKSIYNQMYELLNGLKK